MRLVRKGSVTITVRHGRKAVKSWRITRAGTTTHRRFLKAGRLPRGDYRVTIAAKAASLTQTVTLASRKL